MIPSRVGSLDPINQTAAPQTAMNAIRLTSFRPLVNRLAVTSPACARRRLRDNANIRTGANSTVSSEAMNKPRGERKASPIGAAAIGATEPSTGSDQMARGGRNQARRM